MEIVAATQEEIVEFKQAAAARYAEAGVKPEVADQLFNAQMAKVAAEMNLQPVKSERIEKLASALAQELGVKRAAGFMDGLREGGAASPVGQAAGALGKATAGITPKNIGSTVGNAIGGGTPMGLAKTVGRGIQDVAGAAGKATAGIKTPNLAGVGKSIGKGTGAIGSIVR